MDNIAIEVSNLSKSFSMINKEGRNIREKILRPFSSKHKVKKITALTDINFTVNKGEFFGIIGKNGSGKSTLLNCIMGSIRPDKGSVVNTNGKIIRLALGMGFDPNLSARDNIYINGSILGLSFKEIGTVFEDIIGFAELERFVDVPVKQYSSGMQAKLKFSVAIHAKADIFLMDEFFGGVGDISFRKKSTKVFNDTFLDGRTIIHVTHQLETIKKHCKRVLVIDKGRQIGLGHPDEMIPLYSSLFKKKVVPNPKK
jgi:ABC-2 type transport system ATP-binding protein